MAGKNLYYTYVHVRASSDIPFYVGKGKGWRAKCKYRNKHWHNIARHGYEIKYLAKDIDEEFAFLLEVEAIDVYRRRGYSLANYTDGGEGTSGRKVSEETRKRMSDSLRGKHQPPHTQETKHKIGESSKLRRHTQESKDKMSKDRKGKPKSEAHKIALAEANLGKQIPESAKEKLKNKRWVTDGVNSYFVDKDTPLLPGMWYGRIISKVNKGA